MPDLNLFHFLVTKPVVYFWTHLLGHKSEAQATATVQALEPQMHAEMTTLFGPQVSALVTSTDVTLAQVNAGIAPKLAPGIAAIAKKLAGGDATLEPQLQSYGVAIAAGLIQDLYNAASK